MLRHALVLESSGNYVERQVERWSRQYRSTTTCKIQSMERLMTWLPQHLPRGKQTTTIVHGDFW